MPVVPLSHGPDGQRIAVGNWNFTDDGGTQKAYTIFTITGHVEVQGMFGIGNIAVVGAAVIMEFGISGDTAEFLPQTAGNTIIADELWYDATPTTTYELIDLFAATRRWVLTGQDAILTLGTGDASAGDVNFYTLWRPLSANGLVVPA